MLGGLLSLPAMARDFIYTYEGQTLTYTVIDEDTKTCEVSSKNNVSDDLVIPSKAADGSVSYNVISIGDYAFINCEDLSSVSIPQSINSIGEKAFYDCFSLKKAEFASIQALCKINFKDSYSNPLRLVRRLYIDGKEITEVVIPEGVLSIGNYAFLGCSSITSVTIPSSVTSIGERAFESCEYLTSVTIPESVTSIGKGAFTDSGLTSVTLPESITMIEIGTFWGCTSLTSVFIPESINIIGQRAFYGCSSLTSVNLPKSIGLIQPEVFKDCSSLTSITLPERITFIDDETFSGCRSLTSVVIPNSVEDIGQRAFYGCTGLTSVVIPNSVENIGQRAFANCSGLTSVYYLADKPIEGNVNIFSEETYEKATLFLSEEGLKQSTSIDPWKNFANIKKYISTGIDDVIADNDDAAPGEFYNLNGVKVGNGVEGLAPGLYLRRQGNIVTKVAVK